MRRKNQVKRINTERDVLATAEHPYVVKLFYSFHSREHLYLVMEFVNGGDLHSLLIAVGFLEEPTARQYVAEIALALDYLHYTLRVVHRDIKPDNVLIHQDGHIKLTDFGLSVFGLAADQPPTPPLTPTAPADGQPVPGSGPGQLPVHAAAGTIGDVERPAAASAAAAAAAATANDEMHAKVGTPDYMAPELLLGSTHGIAVDLWALGCVAFELLCGYPPFTGDSVEEVFEHVLEHTQAEAIRWPEEEGHLSSQAIGFVRAMLQPTPEIRPGARSGVVELAGHAFFAGLNWDDLRTRSGTVAFVPELDNARDTSYFVPPHQRSPTRLSELQSPVGSPLDLARSPRAREGGWPRPDPAQPPGVGRQASVDEEEDDKDFLNFSYNNLTSLLARNLELARGGGGGAPATGDSADAVDSTGKLPSLS